MIARCARAATGRRATSIAAAGAALLLLLEFGRRPLASALDESGRAELRAWRLARAERLLGIACALASEPATPCLDLARCHLLRGQFRAAAATLEKLGRARLGDDDRILWLDAAGVAAFNRARPQEALRYHRESGELARARGRLGWRGRALVNEARVEYHTQGRLDRAESLLVEALSIARAEQDLALEADALRNLGVVAWFRGRHESALAEHYLPALTLYRRLDDRHGLAITLSNIGLIHFGRADIRQFLRYQTESLAIKEAIGDQAGESDSHLFLGSVYTELGHLGRGYEAVSRSLRLAERCGYELTRNEADHRLAALAADLGRLDEAVARTENLIARETGAPWLSKYRWGWLARLYLRRGEPARARAALFTMRRLDRATELSESEAAFHYGLAEVDLAEGRIEEAEEQLDRAREAQARLRLGWWYEIADHLLQARLAERRSAPAAALMHLERAMDLESLALEPASAELLAGQKGEVYARFFSLLLDAGEPANGRAAELALGALERLRYRSLHALVARTAGGPRGAAPGVTAGREALAGHPVMPIAELQRAVARLEPPTAVISFLATERTLAALVLGRHGLSLHRLSVGPREVAPKVKLLRQLLIEPGNGDAWRPVARELYRLLLAPLAAAGSLTGVVRLGIVPFGCLHDLPFAALAREDGTADRFLVEEHRLFYPPSISFVARRREAVAAPGEILAFGRNASPLAGGEALRLAETEAFEVAAALGGRALLGAEATESALVRAARGARLLHFATHAASEPLSPMLSRLELAAQGADDGELTVAEVLGLPLAADLVALSACRTGQSFAASGRLSLEVDRVGLPEAFLYAGAASVLASLVPVEDRSAHELVGAFYRRWPRLAKDEALAEAQRELLHADPSRPDRWAAFVLIGDPR